MYWILLQAKKGTLHNIREVLTNWRENSTFPLIASGKCGQNLKKGFIRPLNRKKHYYYSPFTDEEIEVLRMLICGRNGSGTHFFFT